MAETYFVRSATHWGMGPTADAALNAFLKAGGKRKDLQGRTRAMTRVTHDAGWKLDLNPTTGGIITVGELPLNVKAPKYEYARDESLASWRWSL